MLSCRHDSRRQWGWNLLTPHATTDYLSKHLRLNVEMCSGLIRQHRELPGLTHHARPNHSTAQLLLLAWKVHLAAVHPLSNGPDGSRSCGKLLLNLVDPLHWPRSLEPWLHLKIRARWHNIALLLRRRRGLRREIQRSSGSHLGLGVRELRRSDLGEIDGGRGGSNRGRRKARVLSVGQSNWIAAAIRRLEWLRRRGRSRIRRHWWIFEAPACTEEEETESGKKFETTAVVMVVIDLGIGPPRRPRSNN